MRVYRRILGWAVPALDESDLDDAVSTFRELGREARTAGLGSWVSFLLREARSLARTATAGIRRGGVRSLPPRRPRGTRSGWHEGITQDVRYALRTLARAPGFVAVTLISLTFATAVSTVVFSVLNAALLRSPPHVDAPEALVRVFRTSPRNTRGPSSYPDFEDYRARTRTLSDVAAVGNAGFAVGAASEGTRQISGLQVSENYFRVLGISPLMGRGFVPEDVEAGGRVAVIGYNTWQRSYQASPDVLGRTIHLNGQAHTIVGVAPRGMVSVEGPQLVEIVVPLKDHRDNRGRLSLDVVGRRKPGVSLPQVEAEFETIAARLAEEYPRYWRPEGSDAPSGLRVLSTDRARVPDEVSFAVIALAVAGIVGLIMLIACSNVATLVLTRALRRRAEVAVRSAIGASSGRVFRQLLVENLVLFGTAGGLGLLAAHWLTSLVGSGWIVIPPPGLELSVDGRVALFALVLTLGTGLTFGLPPALQASRSDIIVALRGLPPVLRVRALGIRNLFVGAQVGGTLVMVVLTFLLLRSLERAGSMDLGFDPEGVATLTLDVSHAGYEEPVGRQLYADLVARVARLPGVEAAGLASWVPLYGGSTVWGGFEPEGYEPGSQEYLEATMVAITPGYLNLAGMHLLRGRDFNEGDTPESMPVVLVNQAFVDRFWPGDDGVGRHVDRTSRRAPQVVGVVADVAYRDLTSDVGPHVWFPLAQAYQPGLVLHARARGDARALLGPMRTEVAALMPDVPVSRADLMENVSEAAATRPYRVITAGLGTAGLFALLLSMLGLYGVVGYSVSQRTREMGLRMALGAVPARVLGLVLREGLGLSLAGLVPGLVLALVGSRLIRTLLIGVSPLDPLAFMAGTALLVAAVLGAALVPGVRAARAHPMDCIRAE